MKRLIFFLSIICGIFRASSASLRNANCPKVTDLITRDGYQAEEHKITTEDGYILTAHRVSNCTDNDDMEVVILLHGLFFSSADWLLLGPGKALPYLLADKCYDVWLLNSRGNDLSQEHAYLNTNSSEYWDFSWHEMGIYDVPATLDYALNTTGQSNASVICHSQGCTEIFVAANAYPDLADRIKTVCTLAPAAYMGGTSNKIVRYMSLSELFSLKGTTKARKFKFIDVRGLTAAFCSNFRPELCETFLTFGFDLKNTNRSISSILPCYTPSGVSTKQLRHYFQLMNSGQFQYYDYGFWKNIQMYGSFIPPNYRLSQVRMPVCVYSALDDDLVVPVDASRTANELGNVISMHYLPNFTHYDFLYGNNAKELVYDLLIQELEMYRYL